MSAWVRFINKTDYSVIYIRACENREPLMLANDEVSGYFLFPAGSVNAIIYDNRGHIFKSVPLSIRPAVLQTVILK